MLGRLNHVAIAVPDLAAATASLSRHARRDVSAMPQALPEHGVTVVFVELPNTKVELLEPLGEARRLPPSWKRTRPAACTTSATRLTISSPRATS